MKEINNTKRTATVITFTRDAALSSDTQRCSIANTAHTFTELVWDTKAASTIEALTSPYWGNRVASQRPATAQEIAILEAKENRYADYMETATKPVDTY